MLNNQLQRQLHISGIVTLKYLLSLSLILITCAGNVWALDNTEQNGTQEKPLKQSFLSCSIITSEHLTVLQLYQRGLPKQLALEALPNISRDGKKRLDYLYDWAKQSGILNAYADINTNFARCATLVYEQNGRPPADLKEHAYYFCAGENRIRYEMMLKLDRQMSMNEILSGLPKRYEIVAARYKKLIDEEGMLAAFDLTANNLKACLQQIE